LDFSSPEAVNALKENLTDLSMLLESHAKYEEDRIHKILMDRGSMVVDKAQHEHHEHSQSLDLINQHINEILEASQESQKFHCGYKLYLDLRQLFCKCLDHFDYEERVILPELQRLLTDQEIREIDYQSYRQMLPEQMFHMMEVLVPHLNKDDKLNFLRDMKDCEPEKFSMAWNSFKKLLSDLEIEYVIKKLSIIESHEAQTKLDPVKLAYPWEKATEASSSQLDYHLKKVKK
jgi:hypothetical protein